MVCSKSLQMFSSFVGELPADFHIGENRLDGLHSLAAAAFPEDRLTTFHETHNGFHESLVVLMHWQNEVLVYGRTVTAKLPWSLHMQLPCITTRKRILLCTSGIESWPMQMKSEGRYNAVAESRPWHALAEYMWRSLQDDVQLQCPLYHSSTLGLTLS